MQTVLRPDRNATKDALRQTSIVVILCESLVAELQKGAKLLDKVTDEDYVSGAEVYGSVGGHFRHCLDFIGRFLAMNSDGEIDYPSRNRDKRIEADRYFAKEIIFGLIDQLETLSIKEDLPANVRVRSEIDEGIWLGSTIERELEFQLSHMVHHYALIALKLAQRGINVPAGFGVAPSTLKYWERLRESSTGARELSE